MPGREEWKVGERSKGREGGWEGVREVGRRRRWEGGSEGRSEREVLLRITCSGGMKYTL